MPVFLADNHAETFGWITRTFDPDERHQLVLVDAHSDASMAERSEEIREDIRRVPSELERAKRVGQMRESGRVQAYDWIEPLMPRPLDRVCWLAAPILAEPKRAAMHVEALGLLDGRLEVEPRSAGSFARRWETLDLAGFAAWRPDSQPVILALDLDFFAGMTPANRDAVFDTIWKQAMGWPNLTGVAIAVSRPWLADDAEADALVAMACGAVARTRGAFLEIDTTVDDRPDDSKRAAELQTAIPRWDVAQVSAGIRASWWLMRDRLRITDRKRDWEAILKAWTEAQNLTMIHPDHGEIDCDGVWRFPHHEPPALRLDPPAGATGRVRWFALESARAAYDLLPETGLGKSFSTSPGRWIYETRRSLGITEDFALAADAWKPDGAGRVRMEAEVETSGGWLPAAPIELRLSAGEGFRGTLSECFQMPYVFGIAGVATENLSGVETGWGSDCANFLIHAWRRNGIPLAWGDPGRMRAQLASKAKNITLEDAVSISPEEIERGLVIDFGRHVAALWQDREPLGKLGGNDLVVHHLGGVPEIIELEKLARDRPVFSLRVPHKATTTCELRIAGDVVLASDARVEIPGFEKGAAKVFLANLEGVPSLRNPDQAPRYDFRFAPKRLDWLKGKGIDAVSLANNHAGDAGREGLLEGLSALRDAGIGVLGAGRNAADACHPWHTKHDGVRLAVFGICLTDALVATHEQAGVASLPDHSGLLEQEIRKASAAGETVLVMMHGGDEYRQDVNDDQRQWTRWLVARGANLIVGAHPHVTQREERHGGAVIAHSLGNAVYPKALKGADSGEVRSFRLAADGSLRSLR